VVRLEVSRRVRRFAVRRHDERLLQGRRATVHNARPDDGMALELDRQSFQEGVALQGVDRRGCGLKSYAEKSVTA
jgi:hypothetical protein